MNTMSETEARSLLPMYAEGLLEPAQAREVEATLDSAPTLKDELRRIREENALLTEALAPLRPSRSARMRLSDAMFEVHRRAEHVANTLPERGWRIFRICFSLASVALGLAAVTTTQMRALESENLMVFYATLGIFAIGVSFVLLGGPLAQMEARLLGVFSRGSVEPSRLEVLTLEVFGILSVLAAAALFVFTGMM